MLTGCELFSRDDRRPLFPAALSCEPRSHPLSLSRLHWHPLHSTLPANSGCQPPPAVFRQMPCRMAHRSGGDGRTMTAITNDSAVGRPSATTPWYGRLYIQVLVGIALGAAIGYFWPDAGIALKPLGDALIKMIKMAIAPIVFLTVVHGIASLGDMLKAGRIGLKAIIYFEAGTTIALLFGLLVVNLARPGVGMHVSPASLDSKLIEPYVTQSHDQSVVGFLMNIIPQTFGGAFTNGDTLQVLFIAVLFGFGLQRFGERGRPVLALVEALSKILFILIGMIMRL